MIKPDQTIKEVVFKQIERLTAKDAGGIIVDSFSFKILQDETRKNINCLGAELKALNEKEPLIFHRKPVYEAMSFPPYTATLITHKPSCLFCEGEE